MHCLEGLEQHRTMPYRNLRQNLRAFPELGIGSTANDLYQRLQEYYLRELSFPADTLHAFSGIFQAFVGSDYLGLPNIHFYGIPIVHSVLQSKGGDFAMNLAWLTYDTVSSDTRHHLLHISDGSFPSWSWAAIKARRPTSDPGRLHFKFTGTSQMADPIEIDMFRWSGEKMSLDDYIGQVVDYTAFRPLIDITTMVMPGSLMLNAAGSIVFSAFQQDSLKVEQEILHLDQDISNLEKEVTALYVGAVGWAGTTTPTDAIFLLVERCETGDVIQYRRIGVGWHRLNSASLQSWWQEPTKSAASVLRDLCGGQEWQWQTLRLV
jgi:hypothetical protein